MLQKNSMLEVIRADYIRTARAKGLSEHFVVYKHALRNALLPLMVGFGAVLGTFLGGSIIIEPIFGLPGIGVLSLQSLAARDFNVVMAIVVLQSIAILLGQILNDIVYVFVDPRIEYR
jgi:microcin C transport system permease protein